MIPDNTIQACYQSAVGGKVLEKRVSSVILNVYQSAGIEKDDGLRQTLENHAKLDEVGSPARNSMKFLTYIVAWLWRKVTREPRSGGSNSMCPA